MFIFDNQYQFYSGCCIDVNSSTTAIPGWHYIVDEQVGSTSRAIYLDGNNRIDTNGTGNQTVTQSGGSLSIGSDTGSSF